MKCEKCGEKMFEVDGIMMCGSRFCTNYQEIKDDTPTESIIYHREVMLKMKKHKDRIIYLLETKPKTRNYDDWEFLQFYWLYLLGFTKGMEWTKFWDDQIRKFAMPDTISRAKRMICEIELIELKEMLKPLAGVEEGTPDWWMGQHKIAEFLKLTTYIPTNLDLIKAKLEKQSAIFELVVMEKIES